MPEAVVEQVVIQGVIQVRAQEEQVVVVMEAVELLLMVVKI